MNDTLILFLSNAITGVAAWFVGKRKTNAETDNIVLDGLTKSVDLYRAIITDLKREIESLNLKIQELEGKVDKLYSENKKLKQSLGNDVKITKNFK